MTWLFPLYLLGAGAIALPILLHLRRREPKEKVVFSSLMFLERSPHLLTQRSKLERLLLLTLRCLALILLALMFSRPFFPFPGESGLADSGESMVLLLDGSASMRRGDLWQQAVKVAQDRISDSKLKDRVALMRFDRETTTLWSFERDAKEATARKAQLTTLLKGEKAGWSSTDLGGALVAAASSFSTNESTSRSAAPRRIVLLSDLQEGANLDALRGFAWPEDVDLEWVPLTLSSTDNLSVSLAAAESDEDAGIEKSVTTKPTGGVRVRIGNVRESSLDKFALIWENGTGDPVQGYLPAGASRVLRTSPAPGLPQGDILKLSGDAWDFDNRVYVAPSQPRKVRVVYRGPEDADAKEASTPLFYLKRALQPTSSLMPVLAVGATWAGASVALIQSEALKEAEISSLKQWLEAGGLGVVVMSKGGDAAVLSQLADAQSLIISEAAGDEYAMLGEVKSEHPLLSPFADARLRDFTKIRFWHHRKLSWAENDARKPEVLARFDNGNPALLLWQMGKGRLLVMASGWHPADSQLALSTKFVPLLFGWLEAAGFSHQAARSLTVGDELAKGSGLEWVEKPDGSKVEKPTEIVRAEVPGLHRVTQDGETRIVAVNIAPEEGRIHPMESQKLAEAGVKLASSAGGTDRTSMNAAEKQRLDTREDEARQKAWLWVLLALLGVLAWETWLAGRKPRAQTVTA